MVPGALGPAVSGLPHRRDVEFAPVRVKSTVNGLVTPRTVRSPVTSKPVARTSPGGHGA